MAEPKYQAFISYRHDVSGNVAVALEKALRQYAKPLFKPPIPVFRDEKQIGAGQDLRKTIQQALQDSAYLIYIATRDAADSLYVRQELDFWCGELKRQDRLIIVWQKDRLRADPDRDSLDWEASDAIPSSLNAQIRGIPVWLDLTWADDDDLDLRNPRFKTLINSIVARFRGVPPEDLIGEEIRTHRRNLRIRRAGISALVAALVLAIAAGIVAWQQRSTAIAERDRARSNLLVNVSTKLRPWNFTLALDFAAEAYALRLPEPPPEIAEALLRAFYERDADAAVPYRRRLPHHSGVTVVTYSATGDLLASGSEDGLLRVWSADGDLQAAFQAHRLKLLSAAFSRDAKLIATTGLMDTAVRRWEPNGAPLDPLDYGGSEFAFVAIAPNDGTTLVSFGGERYRQGFKLWDSPSDSPVLVVPDSNLFPRSTLLDVAFSRNGELLAGLIERNDGLGLRFWDRTGRELRKLPARRPALDTGSMPLEEPASFEARFSRSVFGKDVVYRRVAPDRWEDLPAREKPTLERFAVSPDGRVFLRTFRDGTVRVWDDQGKLLANFSVPSGLSGAALVGNDGRVATLSKDHTVRMWAPSGELLRTFRGHSEPITAIRTSPNAETLLTASEDRTAKLWPLAAEFAPACKAELPDVASVRFSPRDSELVLIVSTGQHAYLWRPGAVAGDSELAQQPSVREALFSPDGSRILTVQEGAPNLGLWDSEGSLLRHCCAHEAPVSNAVFSPDGKHVLTTYDNGALTVWTTEGAPVATLAERTGRSVKAQFTPAGDRILTYGPESEPRLWDYRGNQIPSKLSPQHEVTSARFSPRGDRLILMSTLGGVSLWDASGGHLPSELEADESGVYAAVWLGRGEAVATTHPRGGVKVWDTNGALRHAWRFPAESHYFTADAAPDGSLLVVPGAGVRSLDGVSLGTLAPHQFLGFLPEGPLLITASRDDPSEIAVRNRQGNLLARLGKLPGTVQSAVVSPKGRLIAILSDTGALAVRCTAAGIYHHINEADFYRSEPDERTRYGIDW